MQKLLIFFSIFTFSILTAQTISADGTVAYVADGRSGLQVIDVTNPTTPSLIGSSDTPGFAQSITLSKDGTMAYVADNSSGLQIVDISNPEMPLIIGSHLKIFLGDNVTIYRSTIGASKIFDEAVLKVGNHSSIGYGTVISVAKEVTIGDNCMIAPNCIIMDNDDHPVSPKKRLEGQPVDPEDVKPVKIGNNVWIGSYCAILKGVKIGDNSVIATHSVITKDVMPNCVYAGYPARPTLRDIQKKFD